jgi:hypothetical protein
MKDQRDRLKTEVPDDQAGKSLHELYLELLCLREEVREAEQLSPKNGPSVQKPARKTDPEH